jgi:colanic acid/amylovoran biosynthesis glycosyltransferase
MDNVTLIVVSPLPGLPLPGGKILLTQKFVDGMALYKELWKGPVTLICQRSDRPSDNLDNVEISAENKFFETICDSPIEPRLREELKIGPSLVLTSEGETLNFVSAVCREMNQPCIYISEYTLRTRLQIIRSESSDLARRCVRSLRQMRQQLSIRRSVSLASGIQCNGTPTYEAYKSLSPMAHLFFDTRTEDDMLASEDTVKRRYADFGSRQLHLIFSGRLKKMKGVDHLPVVASHLLQMGIPFRMSICGDGDYGPQLQQDIERLALTGFVDIKGILDFKMELVPFLKKEADLFVCCHPQGDPSCTYLETWGCGVPIVGYSNEAFSGLSKLTSTGWTTPVGNPKALAEKIASLYRTPDRIAHGAIRSLSFAKEHTFFKTFRRRIDHMNAVVKVHRA